MLPMFGRYSTMSTIYIIYLQMSQATQFWIILQISGVNWVPCRHLLQYSGVNYQSNFKGCILTKKIPNTAWVRVRLCKLQKGCFKRAAASDKVYQWLVHGRWFSPVPLIALKYFKNNLHVHLKIANLRRYSIGLPNFEIKKK